MPTYAALLRGIGPSNPNMRNDKLRGVFIDLGFTNVRTVISSGNVVFDADSTDTAAMEAEVEAAWPARLGFTSSTIIRGESQLRALVDADPFAGLEHGPTSYLLVTFFKHPGEPAIALPHTSPYGSTTILSYADGALFSVTDTTATKTPDFMTFLDRQFGKEISSRTWLTVGRILAKMAEPSPRHP